METETTIVLVHGAWHGAWCWREFEPELHRQGYPVAAVELTSHGRVADQVGDLSSDVALVRQVVAQQSGPVVLYGHSYGGVVVTEAAPGLENVTHLIYQSAFVPDVGDSMATITGGGTPPWLELTEDGLLVVASGWPTKLWYSDCDPAQAAEAERQLQPQSARSFQQAASVAGWRTIPTSYVVCTEDQALVPSGQHDMAARIGASGYELSSGHSPFMSQPDRLAALVRQILS